MPVTEQQITAARKALEADFDRIDRTRFDLSRSIGLLGSACSLIDSGRGLEENIQAVVDAEKLLTTMRSQLSYVRRITRSAYKRCEEQQNGNFRP